MPEISFTSFVDFILATGTRKVTRVREISEQMAYDYEPKRDFYKGVRQAIRDYQLGQSQAFDVLLADLPKSKETHYRQLVARYLSFTQKHPSVGTFTPKLSRWQYGDLVVRINPELGFDFGGKRTLVKLYFKADKATKERADIALRLMELGFRESDASPAQVALLDIRRGKLFLPQKLDPALDVLVKGEALSFAEMWRLVHS